VKPEADYRFRLLFVLPLRMPPRWANPYDPAHYFVAKQFIVLYSLRQYFIEDRGGI
jgi:hypothetical protein